MSKNTSLILILNTVVVLFFVGCKASYSFTGADIPAEAQTFSVETFQNNSPLTSVSYCQNITENLKEQLSSQTRLNLVKTNGDLQYSGTVLSYEVVPNAVLSNETAALSRLRVKVRVNYINSFDEKKNFEREFERFADFPADKNLNTEESRLIEEINKQLIQDIFNASLGNW